MLVMGIFLLLGFQSVNAQIVATPAEICEGGSISFTGRFGFIHSWTFQNGNPATSSVANPVVVFNSAGTQTITHSAWFFGWSSDPDITVTVVADPVAPLISKSPDVAEVCEGAALTISVDAAGSGGVTGCSDEYRYSTDGGGSWTAWSGSPPSFNAVTGTNLVQSHRSCGGSDGCDDNINEVSWIVMADPTIDTQPVGAFICSGGSHSMSVAVSGGTPSLTYQWEESDDDGAGDSWANAVGGSGANSANYSSPTLTSTIYYRVIINAAGLDCGTATSSSVAVSVVPDHSIDTHPSGATICNGGTHSMSVVVSDGTPSLAYQWEESDDDGAGDPWANVTGGSGATSANFTTPALTTTTYYRVVVNDLGSGCGSVNSSSATVVVVPDPVAPVISKNPDVAVTIMPDTIICDAEIVSFTFTTPSYTTGIVRYNLTTVSTGNLNGISADGDFDLINLSNTLDNTSNTVQFVTYTFTPFIENARSGKNCYNGVPVDITVYVNPTTPVPS